MSHEGPGLASPYLRCLSMALASLHSLYLRDRSNPLPRSLLARVEADRGGPFNEFAVCLLRRSTQLCRLQPLIRQDAYNAEQEPEAVGEGETFTEKEHRSGYGQDLLERSGHGERERRRELCKDWRDGFVRGIALCAEVGLVLACTTRSSSRSMTKARTAPRLARAHVAMKVSALESSAADSRSRGHSTHNATGSRTAKPNGEVAYMADSGCSAAGADDEAAPCCSLPGAPCRRPSAGWPSAHPPPQGAGRMQWRAPLPSPAGAVMW